MKKKILLHVLFCSFLKKIVRIKITLQNHSEIKATIALLSFYSSKIILVLSWISWANQIFFDILQKVTLGLKYILNWQDWLVLLLLQKYFLLKQKILDIRKKRKFTAQKSFLVQAKIIWTRTKYFCPSPNLFWTCCIEGQIICPVLLF